MDFRRAALALRCSLVRDWFQQILGDATASELTLVAAVFVTILAFSWAPRIGSTVGGWFDRADV
jgi:hypothetical protein